MEAKFNRPTFEEDDRLIDWKQEHFNQPREFTIKNIRDIFFGLLNQSKAQERICDAEDNIGRLWEKCQALTEFDTGLDEKINKTRIELDQQHADFYEKYMKTVEEHETKFINNMKRIKANTEQLEAHKQVLDDYKGFKDNTIKQNERLEGKITKSKNQNHDDLVKAKEEINVRIEDLDKILADQGEAISQLHVSFKQQIQQQISAVKEEVLQNQKNEIDTLKNFVRIATEKVNTNNDGIYEKYDEKLKKIKDVCAQYFSKYEKHLINHQTIVKDLERQQEKWVQMIIKPQELNQARLYAIETRIKENEQGKMKDFDFMKETMKKLIYAIEQNQIQATQGSLAVIGGNRDLATERESDNQLPNLIKGNKQKPGHHRAITSNTGAEKTASGFFGQSKAAEQHSPVRVTVTNSMHNARKSQPNNDILFLKRLLYLKASIDNETTLNTFSVPFEQERIRDLAHPD